MRIVRRAEQRLVPWKNGRGHTLEVLVWPAGADLAAFSARLSLATIEADGPFSRFEGIDRWIAVATGAGMDLVVAGALHRLAPGDVLPFSGDAPTEAHLWDGPVRDLNWMVRRPGRGAARLGWVDALVAEVPSAVYVLEGALGPLEAGDAAELEAGERLVGRARVFLGELR